MTVGPVEYAAERSENDGSNRQASIFHGFGSARYTFIRCSLPSAPPHGDAGENHDERQQKLTGGANPIHLRARQGDATVLRLFRSNRNEIFIGGEPVHGVEGQVAIAVEPDE